MHPGMAIDTSRDGNRCIPDGDLEMTIDACRGMAIAVCLDGFRFHPGMASWDGARSIPGWR